MRLPGVHQAVQLALAEQHALVLSQPEDDETLGPAGVCSALGKLLDEGTGADVRFLVAASGREFLAHRLILCARSEYFARMFGSAAADTGLSEASLRQVKVEECTEEGFGTLLRWLYTGHASLRKET